MGVKGSYIKHSKDRLSSRKHEPIEIKEEKYYDRLYDISRYGSNKKAFQEWLDVSMNQQSEETVREILLSDKPYDICITFLCHCQSFSEDFLEEIYWLTNNIFKNIDYDKDLLKTLIEFTDEFDNSDDRFNVMLKIKKNKPLTRKEQKYKFLKGYNYDNERTLVDYLLIVFSEGSRDRLDWSELNKRNLSDRFRLKYSKEFEKVKFIVDNSYDEDNSYIPSSTGNLY